MCVRALQFPRVERAGINLWINSDVADDDDGEEDDILIIRPRSRFWSGSLVRVFPCGFSRRRPTGDSFAGKDDNNKNCVSREEGKKSGTGRS